MMAAFGPEADASVIPRLRVHGLGPNSPLRERPFGGASLVIKGSNDRRQSYSFVPAKPFRLRAKGQIIQWRRNARRTTDQ